MKAGVIYINSTLRAEQARSEGAISSFHFWGFVPAKCDVSLSHRQTRIGIHLRKLLGGLDLRIMLRTLGLLVRGYRCIYLVTQPDLIHVLPLLIWLFPSLRTITWVWTEDEVRKWKIPLKRCAHVFCLTEKAHAACDEEIGGKASLQLLGAEFESEPDDIAKTFDLCLAGRTGRDAETAAITLEHGNWSVVVSAGSSSCWKGKMIEHSKVQVVETCSHADVLRWLRASKAAWIPLHAGDPFPVGYTNLVDALLVGTPVVISDCSTIPKRVLSLRGVYLYKTGDPASLHEKTIQAIKESESVDVRKAIQAEARETLDGKELERTVRDLLAVQPC